MLAFMLSSSRQRLTAWARATSRTSSTGWMIGQGSLDCGSGMGAPRGDGGGVGWDQHRNLEGGLDLLIPPPAVTMVVDMVDQQAITETFVADWAGERPRVVGGRPDG